MSPRPMTRRALRDAARESGLVSPEDLAADLIDEAKRKGLPVLLAVPASSGASCSTWRAWCPSCAAFHSHAARAGLRRAHCDGGPWKTYVLVAASSVEAPETLR